MKLKSKSSLLPCVAVASLIVVLPYARADVFTVSNAQDLQNALTTAASNGADDTVQLNAGYYVGNFNFNSSEARSLTLMAAPGLTNTDVTIDAGNTLRALNLTSSTATNLITVQGLTFLRRSASSSTGALRISAGNSTAVVIAGCRFLTPSGAAGLGLEVAAGFNLTVVDCIFTGRLGSGDSAGNVAGVTGNIVLNSCLVSSNQSYFSVNTGATRLVTNCTFLGNSGGGLLIGGGGTSTATVEGSSFIGNGGTGGAYFNTQNNLLRHCTFANNAIGASVSGSSSLVTDNTFANNSGVGLSSSPNCTVLRNTFSGNTGGGMSHTLAGGSTTYTISSNLFLGNSKSGSGAGLSVADASGPAVGGLISYNTFIGNSANGSSSDGGGLYVLTLVSAPTVRGNLFRQNNAGRHGGAVYVSAVSPILSDNLIVKNSAPNGAAFGGGVWVTASSTLRFVNNTLTQNSTGGGGGGVRINVAGVVEVLDFYNNIIWGNTATGNGDDVYLSGTGQSKRFRYNNAHDLFGVWDLAGNNLDLAPKFFDPVGGDFHLQSSSPCVNSGTNGAPGISSLDLDAEPRIANGTVDMGCYEFSTVAAHPADGDTNFVITASEFNAYAAAWKAGQTWSNAPTVIPADFVTRAGYLLTNGGAYFNDGSARPVNWKPTP